MLRSYKGVVCFQVLVYLCVATQLIYWCWTANTNREIADDTSLPIHRIEPVVVHPPPTPKTDFTPLPAGQSVAVHKDTRRYSAGPAAITDKDIRLQQLADMSSESDDTDTMLNYLLHKYRETIGQVKRQMLLRVTNADPVVVQNQPHCSDKKGVINVGSLNLWHLNPPWEKRKAKIVEFFKKNKPDIIGFQEVRFIGEVNQAQLIANELNDPRYTVKFCDVHPEPQGKNEGIAIMSRFPILSTGAVSLKGGSPRNRKIFHARIQVPDVGEVVFFVTHLTYEESKQCAQMMAVLSYLNTFDPNGIQILVGDLNIYFDFEWPMDLATRPINKFTFHKYNPCRQAVGDSLEVTKESAFRDAWEDVYKDLSRFPGSTFPNFQDERAAHLDPCRPDRILIRNTQRSKNLVTCDTYLFGQEMFPWRGKDANGMMREGMKMSDHKGVMTQLLWNADSTDYAGKTKEAQSWFQGTASQPAQPLLKSSSPEKFLSLHQNHVPRLSVPAKVESSVPHYSAFVPDFAFDGDPTTFFWSNRAPQAGETFKVILTEPRMVFEAILRTGVQELNGQDKVLHGTLCMSPSERCCGDSPGGPETITAAKVNGQGIAEIHLPEPITIKCIQLTIDEPQENWVVISEISIK